MSDAEFKRAEQLIFATVEELIVARIHLENDEREEAKERIMQCFLNVDTLQTMTEGGAK